MRGHNVNARNTLAERTCYVGAIFAVLVLAGAPLSAAAPPEPMLETGWIGQDWLSCIHTDTEFPFVIIHAEECLPPPLP